MSDSSGPVRRRRIAGEGKPAVQAKTPVVRKGPAKKVAAAKKPAERKGPARKVTQPPKTPVASPSARTPPPVAASEQPEVAARGWTRPPRRELRWLAPAVLVTIAALVLGGLLLVKGVTGWNDGGGDLEKSNSQAAAAAGSAAETIFSFRYDKLDDHLAASKALMTPAFAKDFDKIAPALTELAPQRKIVVQAVTRNSAAMACGDECSAKKATVLVFLDQARLIGDSKDPTVFGNRITVSMVKRDGSWLVSQIRAL